MKGLQVSPGENGGPEGSSPVVLLPASLTCSWLSWSTFTRSLSACCAARRKRLCITPRSWITVTWRGSDCCRHSRGAEKILCGSTIGCRRELEGVSVRPFKENGLISVLNKWSQFRHHFFCGVRARRHLPIRSEFAGKKHPHCWKQTAAMFDVRPHPFYWGIWSVYNLNNLYYRKNKKKEY